MGLVAHVTLAGYLVELFLPSQPAFLDALELARRHSAASSRKSQLEVLTDELWARGTATGNSVTIDDCRTVQDHSYRHRRDSPQVSELFYRRYKRQDEDAMHRATVQKVAALNSASPLAD